MLYAVLPPQCRCGSALLYSNRFTALLGLGFYLIAAKDKHRSLVEAIHQSGRVAFQNLTLSTMPLTTNALPSLHTKDSRWHFSYLYIE